MVLVRAGPTVDSLRPFAVNNNTLPLPINTPHCEGYLMIHLQNHKPTQASHPESLPTSSYFDNKRRQIAITFSGRFKSEFSGDDIMLVNDFEKPVKTPSLFGVFVKLAKLIDPGFCADGIKDPQPWLGSWMLGVNTLNVANYATEPVQKPRRDSKMDMEEDFKKLSLSIPNSLSLSANPCSASPMTTNSLQPSFPYAYAPSSSLTTPAVEESNPISSSSSIRKKHFSNSQNRKLFKFTTDNIYTFEYYDHRINFNKLDVDLGVMKVNAKKYLNDQPLRFVMRTRDKGTVFWVVEISDWDDDIHAKI
ncbi:hypothetical protein BKA69DRAFT_1078561 [Paraphysoderma sedebokerense]|nr:hypothetical protein BKA69DRAFT_1078561 [Paraphysoderma sedebokerense]